MYKAVFVKGISCCKPLCRCDYVEKDDFYELINIASQFSCNLHEMHHFVVFHLQELPLSPVSLLRCCVDSTHCWYMVPSLSDSRCLM